MGAGVRRTIGPGRRGPRVPSALAARLADLKRGGDSWRKRYNELARTPIPQWPSDAVDYP